MRLKSALLRGYHTMCVECKSTEVFCLLIEGVGLQWWGLDDVPIDQAGYCSHVKSNRRINTSKLSCTVTGTAYPG